MHNVRTAGLVGRPVERRIVGGDELVVTIIEAHEPRLERDGLRHVRQSRNYVKMTRHFEADCRIFPLQPKPRTTYP